MEGSVWAREIGMRISVYLSFASLVHSIPFTNKKYVHCLYSNNIGLDLDHNEDKLLITSIYRSSRQKKNKHKISSVISIRVTIFDYYTPHCTTERRAAATRSHQKRPRYQINLQHLWSSFHHYTARSHKYITVNISPRLRLKLDHFSSVRLSNFNPVVIQIIYCWRGITNGTERQQCILPCMLRTNPPRDRENRVRYLMSKLIQ